MKLHMVRSVMHANICIYIYISSLKLLNSKGIVKVKQVTSACKSIPCNATMAKLLKA